MTKNSVTQNRHQFDITVPDLRAVLTNVLKYRGVQIEEVSESIKELSLGIYYPDNNSIVFKQLIK